MEIVVSVHNASRPVERAVASALRNSISLRVTVIVHNTAPEGIRERLGAILSDPRVRMLELQDGVRSPANAFNFGLEHASGDFLCLVGSDDELESGAVDAWASLAARESADVVVAPIRRAESGGVPAPRVRRGRIAPLDGDRDRLFERVAPLGLVRLARFPGLRFSEGLPRGVDQIFGLHLWFSGARVAFDPSTPAYVEWDDQKDRVTKSGDALIDNFRYLDLFDGDAVFRSMTRSARRAVVARMLRVYVVGSIPSRLTETGLTDDDRTALASILERLRLWAPGVDGLLAWRDRRAIAAALDPLRSGADVRAAIGDRSRFFRADVLLTVNPLLVLHRHAPLRSLLAGRRVARAVAASTP